MIKKTALLVLTLISLAAQAGGLDENEQRMVLSLASLVLPYIS